MALEKTECEQVFEEDEDDDDDMCSNILKLLECHVCTNPMYPPIHQCQNGHTLCSTCEVKVKNKCPTCREVFGEIRCLSLEKVAESLKQVPCNYNSFGCPEFCPYNSVPNHELQCNFRPYNCPYAKSACSVTGDVPFLVSHLMVDHKVDMLEKFTFIHRYVSANPREVKNATWTPTVIHCFGEYFVLHFEAFMLGKYTPVYISFLRFMGGKSEAGKYSYSLEVEAKGRKQLWEGKPRSIRDDHRTVRDSNDCLIIPRNMALFYSEGDGKELSLRVACKIWEKQQS